MLNWVLVDDNLINVNFFTFDLLNDINEVEVSRHKADIWLKAKLKKHESDDYYKHCRMSRHYTFFYKVEESTLNV